MRARRTGESARISLYLEGDTASDMRRAQPLHAFYLFSTARILSRVELVLGEAFLFPIFIHVRLLSTPRIRSDLFVLAPSHPSLVAPAEINSSIYTRFQFFELPPISGYVRRHYIRHVYGKVMRLIFLMTKQSPRLGRTIAGTPTEL